ncbi:hypothetical protein GPJ56_002937 [Histomonas meleagridis]|uniref:uncharacterized protein n=1 Tax=Histomonas meleagridis TaxID=135588 RepID=UPI00355A1384|nr:hypothetical protein GPJ56_002937 [Histomonas meleagridis]KAH0800363.1 hypothetical protein GO595_006774 [Histomonas meleagridis]
MFAFLIFKLCSSYYPTETISWQPKPNTPAWPSETEEWSIPPTEYPNQVNPSSSTIEIVGIAIAAVFSSACIIIVAIVWIFGPKLQKGRDRMDKKLDQPLVESMNDIHTK